VLVLFSVNIYQICAISTYVKVRTTATLSVLSSFHVKSFRYLLPFFLLEIFASFNEQLNHLLAYDVNSLVHFLITNYIITVRFLNFDMHIAHNESQGLGSKMI